MLHVLSPAAGAYSKTRHRALSLFLVLSFGLAWPVVTVGDYLWSGALAAYAVHSTAMLMPGLACLVVRRWITGAGEWRDIGLRIGSRGAYAAVVFGLLLLWGLPRALDLFTGAQVRAFSTQRFLFTALLLFTGLIPAFGEELGWRGFLLPALLPMGRRRALLLHGAIWGAWHWPLLFAARLRGDIGVVECVVGMIAMLPVTAAIGAIVGWLWLRSASILLVTVFHFCYDFFRDGLNLWIEPGPYADLLDLLPVLAMASGALLVLLVAERRHKTQPGLRDNLPAQNTP